MTVVNLIPFVVGLIGFDSCLKSAPDIWKNGTEFNFRFDVNASSVAPPGTMKTGTIFVSNVTSTLKCRSFSSTSSESQSGPDGLQCVIHDAQLEHYEVSKVNTAKAHKVSNDKKSFESVPLAIANQTFEILYANHGIREIRIQLPVSQWRMNIFRSIASLLDYGFSKFDNPEGKFNLSAMENSTIGECNTHFEISKESDVSAVQWESQCNELKLNSLTHGHEKPAMIFSKKRKTKSAVVDNCVRNSPYFFGGEDEPAAAEIIESQTVFLMSPKAFGGQTINKGFMTFRNISVPIQEEISIRLDSIKPATTEFKRIDGFGITRLYAHDKINTPE